MIIATDIDQDLTPAIIDTGVTVTVTHVEVIPGHITDSHAAAHHTTETQVYITTDKTPHTEGPHHTEVFPGDCSRSRPHTSYKHNHKASSKVSYSSNWAAWKNKDKKY